MTGTPAEPRPAGAFDLLTVAALGVAAYVVANLVHEGVGHGGACWATGARPVAVSASWLECDRLDVGPWADRAVSAAGTLANLVLGAACAGAHRARPPSSPHARYLLGLSAVINLLQGGGYMMVSPLAGFGDWKHFVAGFEGAALWAWKIGLTAAGLGVSLLAVRFGRVWLEPFLGDARRQRARVLCWTPYFAGALVFLGAAFRDPLRDVALTGLLAAHLGGTAWLAWFLPFIVGDVVPPGAGAAAPPGLPRDARWLALGGIAAGICIGVLGPSLPLARGR